MGAASKKTRGGRVLLVHKLHRSMSTSSTVVHKLHLHRSISASIHRVRPRPRRRDGQSWPEDSPRARAQASQRASDPERLRRRLRRATGKKVDLLLPKEPAGKQDQAAGGKKCDPFEDAAELQALLASLQLQQGPVARQQYGGQGAVAAAWAANQQQRPRLPSQRPGKGAP